MHTDQPITAGLLEQIGTPAYVYDLARVRDNHQRLTAACTNTYAGATPTPARGHFPSEQAVLKCLYLVTRSLDPTGDRPRPMDDALEAGAECLRHHLR